MALRIDSTVEARGLRPKLERLFEASGDKILDLRRTWDGSQGTPVFTVNGKYTSRGWTEWTEGFQVGAAFLQFDATGEREFLKLGRDETVRRMASHVSHIGVHDHGFNNISTFGNLWRLIREGKADSYVGDQEFCELALKVSGAVQASRWTPIENDGGYIYSFNGPHSLFIDTMRSLRSLAVAHQLGHVLMAEHDQRISLLERLLMHGATTARFAIYYGEGRDVYDVPGRTAHESIFNTNDGRYRCPSSQQGFSPFSTWMRGLAWAVCGFAEQLEFLTVNSVKENPAGEAPAGTGVVPILPISEMFLRAALVTADFYIENCCACGVPMWDTGAPNLYRLGDYQNRPADPFNGWEPVDSSAAAIAAQGLLRLGRVLAQRHQAAKHDYRQAGLTILNTLLQEPYLSTAPAHQGLLLHSVYHRPNGWDFVHPGQSIPNGESSMWGDYHLRELALMVLKEIRGEPISPSSDPDEPNL